MSAAEKLRALMDDLDGEDADVGIPLPQIVALVEAAEIAYDGFGEDDHRFYGSQKRITAALAALDEVLL